MRKTMQGFTLIEVMIVVAIVAILAAVAYPSYQDSVTKSRRADAQGVLMGFAGAMERHYTNENTYTDAGGIYTAPTETAKYYTLTIEAADSSTYTLRATPKNSQAGDGYLEILSTGVKRWNAASGLQNCWAKSC